MDLDIRYCECGYPVEVVTAMQDSKFYTLPGTEIHNCLLCGQELNQMYDSGKLERTTELDHMPVVFRKLSPDQKKYVDFVLAEIIEIERSNGSDRDINELNIEADQQLEE